jgi:hypothetical protein
METITIVLSIAGCAFFVLYLARRRSRLNSDED